MEKSEVLPRDFWKIIKSINKSNITIIYHLTLNIKISKERWNELVGPCGLNKASERGERVFLFCRNNYYAWMNNVFDVPKIRLNP